MLILLAGQSNALGFGNTDPAPYIPTARVQIWTDTDGDGMGDAFNYMLPGHNTGTASQPHAWGPEVGFAQAWLEANPDGVLWLGKVAKGSTGLAEDAGALDWSPGSAGELFDQAAFVSWQMRSNLGVGHLDGVAWMQGETDAYDPAKAAGYAVNLRDFVAEAREEWAVTEFALGRISHTPTHSEAVRVAQWLVDQEDDHVASFKTIGYGMQADGLHYDASAHLAIGRGMFDAF